MIGSDDAGAKPAAQAQAILARQHHVENDEVDAASRQRAVHLAAVRCGRHLERIGPEIARDQRASFTIVFNDQNAGVMQPCDGALRAIRWAFRRFFVSDCFHESRWQPRDTTGKSRQKVSLTR